MRKTLIPGLLVISFNCLASEPAITSNNNLCSTGEQSLFFCKGENKIAGICASDDLGNLSGFAQYRAFNIKQNNTEFVFPKTLTPPERNFIINSHPLPGGIDVQITFSDNGFLYVIHERDAPIGGEGFEGHSEILIRHNGKVIETIHCLNDDSEVRRPAYESFFWQN
jgi:hypothetical protein